MEGRLRLIVWADLWTENYGQNEGECRRNKEKIHSNVDNVFDCHVKQLRKTLIHPVGHNVKKAN